MEILIVILAIVGFIEMIFFNYLGYKINKEIEEKEKNA
jgi:hypothetical protein